jgi:hypothetical protein
VPGRLGFSGAVGVIDCQDGCPRFATKTLVTVVRYIDAESDFQLLTRFLEVYVNEEEIR